jgi:Flp pilus assembly protein TadB
LEPELALTGTSLEAVCGQAVLAAGVAGVLPPFCWALTGLGGMHLSFIVPLWVSLVGSACGAAFPFMILRSEAKVAARCARRVVGTYLDLVVLCLAGGMGIEGALHAAAEVGVDPVSHRLAAALQLARDCGETPWSALAGLGEELGIGELSELAAAVGLAGTEGARIRATLSSKASSIRRHELADAETEANTVTERLFLPGVLLLVGFLLFIGYPAFSRIAAGF